MNSKIIAFAIEAHHNTNHFYDGKPYSVHLSMVVMNALKHIDCIPVEYQEAVLSACWLHDTIEDCRMTYNDIKAIAGIRVAHLVYAVTNEKGRNRKERANHRYYEGILNTPFAKYIKLCDRLANVQYSREQKSKMYDLYKQENDDFLKSLFPTGNFSVYADIVYELNQLFQ